MNMTLIVEELLDRCRATATGLQDQPIPEDRQLVIGICCKCDRQPAGVEMPLNRSRSIVGHAEGGSVSNTSAGGGPG